MRFLADIYRYGKYVSFNAKMPMAMLTGWRLGARK